MASLRGIFDKPFAGPDRRLRYESALGKFLVAFNAVEDYMRYTAAEITKSVNRLELWEDHLVGDDFHRQIKNLRLLVLAEPYFDDMPFDRLIALNKTRNKLAHGHYDQNLFSDDFQIVGKRERISITIADIEKAAGEADGLAQELANDLANFWNRDDVG